MRIFESKRFMMTFVVVLLWLIFGLTEALVPKKPDYISLSAYFASLTGLVGSYLWGESVRQSDGTTPMFMKGKTSKREVIMYSAVIGWTLMGIATKVFMLNIVQMAAYFAVLTPFVSGYILATTYKPSTGDSQKPA